jgi:MarR family transcriptional regulator, organic hydroperoxide resistance regulator
VTPPNRIPWFTDLIRLEIVLWNRVNARLKAEHALSLAFFETLDAIGRSPEGKLRIGDVARALRITQGATSKLIDRIEAAGLIHRETDADDRRASRVVLTESGMQTLVAASTTYEAELASVLDTVLNAEEQQHMHTLMRRLLRAADTGEVE